MTKTPKSSFNYSSSKHFLYRKQEKNETLMIDALFWRKNCFTYLNDKRKLQMFFSRQICRADVVESLRSCSVIQIMRLKTQTSL